MTTLDDNLFLMRPDGTRITPRQLRRGLNVSLTAGTLANSWASLLGIPLTMFFECLRASGVLLGAVITVQQLAMLVQIPTALFAERLTARKGFWAAVAFAHRGLWFVPVVLMLWLPKSPEMIAPITVGAVAVSAVFAQMGTVLWFSWMSDLVPERMRGRYWGRRLSYVMSAYLATLLLFGFILDRFPDPREPGGTFAGFILVFGLGALIGVVDIFIHTFVPEPRPVPAARLAGRVRRLLEPLLDRDFRALILSMGAWTFAIGLLGQFSIVYLTRNFGATYTQLALLTVSAALGTVLAGFFWGSVVQRIGERALGATVMFLAPCFSAVWFFVQPSTVCLHLPWVGPWSLPQPVALLLVVNLFAGAVHSGLVVCQMNFLSALTPRDARKTLWIAVYFTVVGLMAAAGPLLGGAVVDALSVHPLRWRLPLGASFDFMQALVVLYAAVAWAVALPLILRIQREVADMPFPTVLSRLFLESPARLLVNAYATGMSMTTRAIGRAAREMGGKAQAIAVSHLIEQLDNPSPAVRAEAIAALGQMGSPEAVAALVRELQDPNSDLAPQIARALQQARSGREMDILVSRLSAPESRGLIETIRALGEIGDGRASEPLLALLKASTDSQVIAASGEALARIGEIAAIWEILPQMKRTRNPVLKHSLAIAIGNLLGQRKGFDKLLSSELEFRGCGVARLLKNLRRDIRRASRFRMQSEGLALIRRIGELQAAYEQDDVSGASELLFEIAIEMAALDFGIEYGGDTEILLELMVWRKPRFGLGLWYIDLLAHRWEAAGFERRDWLDVLLGIYFLAAHEADEIAP